MLYICESFKSSYLSTVYQFPYVCFFVSHLIVGDPRKSSSHEQYEKQKEKGKLRECKSGAKNLGLTEG